MHYHIHDPMLSVDAEHVSLSKKYVRQLFDEVRGVSLSSYILNARIDKVKELLRNTDLPITDISQQSGFQTKSHFFTAFKKAMGMTPSQYRLSSNEANA
ncbi:helix-turn-helix transcriptional regulator [Paenibacillus azoreducens]|uniref:helix-turn-helix transcriptional regulator n=1 Tax=Paenibacillus azoreducens TaxID=116718 RepID=UPI0039F46B99